jgi:hypothetical protein
MEEKFFRKILEYLSFDSDEFVSERSLVETKDLAVITKKGSEKLN